MLFLNVTGIAARVIVLAVLSSTNVLADAGLPTSVAVIPGSPVEAVGCTASRGYDEYQVDGDFYIRANASFRNISTQDATEVDIGIHLEGAYGNTDLLLVKRGTFSPGVRIDPKRNAAISMLQPYTTNIDTDGVRQIDIWDVVSATCEVLAVKFADGSIWRYDRNAPANAPSIAPVNAPRCHYDFKAHRYVCQ